MAKTLAVFGATGQQGGSIVNYVLNDAELSRQYKIRAITRDVNSEKSKTLREKVDVVRGNADDRSSLESALAGSHTVFIMTTPTFGPDAVEIEYSTAKRIADVAVGQGVEYIIFSTLPDVIGISNGEYTQVTAFDAKAKAEQYIRSLPVRSAFYCPGSFMENFQSQAFLAPRPASNDTWILARPVPSTSRWPLLDATDDGPKFIGAILAEPEKYQGKRICAASGWYTMEDVAAAMSRSTGQQVVSKEVAAKEFKDTLPHAVQGIFMEAFAFYREFDYFGPDAEASVAWAAGQVKGGTLATLDDFFRKHPFRLEA